VLLEEDIPAEVKEVDQKMINITELIFFGGI
jgi:hypothetical protein